MALVWVNIIYAESSCSLVLNMQAFDSRAANEWKHIVKVYGFLQQGLHCSQIKLFMPFILLVTF